MSVSCQWDVVDGSEWSLQSLHFRLRQDLLNKLTHNCFCYRKFEEIYPPEVAEFVYITDDTYSKKQVLRMEHLVLKVLAFDLAAPTVNQFLTQYFLHLQPANCKVESLAMVSPVWGLFLGCNKGASTGFVK